VKFVRKSMTPCRAVDVGPYLFRLPRMNENAQQDYDPREPTPESAAPLWWALTFAPIITRE